MASLYLYFIFIGKETIGWESLILIKVRLEQSNFFCKWTGGKMEIRLEKPALNILKLTGGKNKKARRGLYVKNFG